MRPVIRELRQLKSSPAELRKFGLLVGAVFAMLAGWLWWRGKPFYWYGLVAAAPLIGLGAVWPTSLKWVYLIWMSAGLAMGFIVSTLLLTVFYYAVLTPIGILARLVGKDFLHHRLQPEAASYWVQRKSSAPKAPQEYERQF